MEEIIILNLRRIGSLESCVIVPDKVDSNLWNLQVKIIDGHGGDIYYLKTQRGVTRTFSSVDTAFKTAVKLGFNEVKIVGDSMVC